MKLNNTQCKNAKPKANPYKLADGGGLYLLVKVIGKRWFVASLNTKNKSEADKKYTEAHAAYERDVEEFALHRCAVPRSVQVSLLPELKARYAAFRRKHSLTLGDSYGEFTLEMRNRHVQKVAFPHLDLSALYAQTDAPGAKEKLRLKLRN